MIITLFFVAEFVYGEENANRSYQSRQLLKLYHQKTQKPRKEEKAIQQKVWDKMRRQYQYYARLGKKQAAARVEYGKQVAKQQSQFDHLIPVKQSGALRNVLVESAISTKFALQRKTEREYLEKKSQRLRYENVMRPRDPIYNLKFRPR